MSLEAPSVSLSPLYLSSRRRTASRVRGDPRDRLLERSRSRLGGIRSLKRPEMAWLACVFAVSFWVNSASAAALGNSDAMAAAWSAHNVFALDRLLSADQGDHGDRIFYRGASDIMLGRSAVGRTELRTMLSRHAEDRKMAEQALRLLADDAARRDDYNAYADNLTLILDHYDDLLTLAELDDIAQSRALASELRSAPAQAVVRGGPVRLATHRDAAGLRHLPARIGSEIADPVFDTGANFSVASTSFAQAHRIRLLRGPPVTVDSAAGGKVAARLGLGRVQVGETTINNVVFLVMKDEDLRIPQLSLDIPAILGFPVLRALGHLRLDATGSIEVGLKPMTMGRRDLAFDELTPLVRVTYAGSDVPFVLDTGAKLTTLAKRFEARFPAAFVGAQDRAVRRAGAGGMQTGTTRIVPAIAFAIAGAPIKLRDVAMGAESGGDATAYGRIGGDALFAQGVLDLDFRTQRVCLDNSC